MFLFFALVIKETVMNSGRTSFDLCSREVLFALFHLRTTTANGFAIFATKSNQQAPKQRIIFHKAT